MFVNYILTITSNPNTPIALTSPYRIIESTGIGSDAYIIFTLDKPFYRQGDTLPFTGSKDILFYNDFRIFEPNGAFKIKAVDDYPLLSLDGTNVKVVNSATPDDDFTFASDQLNMKSKKITNATMTNPFVTQPTTNGQALSSTTDGTLSWFDPSIATKDLNMNEFNIKDVYSIQGRRQGTVGQSLVGQLEISDGSNGDNPSGVGISLISSVQGGIEQTSYLSIGHVNASPLCFNNLTFRKEGLQFLTGVVVNGVTKGSATKLYSNSDGNSIFENINLIKGRLVTSGTPATINGNLQLEDGTTASPTRNSITLENISSNGTSSSTQVLLTSQDITNQTATTLSVSAQTGIVLTTQQTASPYNQSTVTFGTNTSSEPTILTAKDLIITSPSLSITTKKTTSPFTASTLQIGTNASAQSTITFTDNSVQSIAYTGLNDIIIKDIIFFQSNLITYFNPAFRLAYNYCESSQLILFSNNNGSTPFSLYEGTITETQHIQIVTSGFMSQIIPMISPSVIPFNTTAINLPYIPLQLTNRESGIGGSGYAQIYYDVPSWYLNLTITLQSGGSKYAIGDRYTISMPNTFTYLKLF
jgi:hypothetical protein